MPNWSPFHRANRSPCRQRPQQLRQIRFCNRGAQEAQAVPGREFAHHLRGGTDAASIVLGAGSVPQPLLHHVQQRFTLDEPFQVLGEKLHGVVDPGLCVVGAVGRE